MQSNQKTRTRLRIRTLPACLALALGVGTSLFVPAQASTHLAGSTGAHLDAQLAPWRRGVLSTQANEVRANQMRRMLRTPPAVPASAVLVTNCDDAGPGSLRDAVNAAADGDTIDMTALTCSKITLATGAIGIGQDNLTLAGPGFGNLDIDAVGASRVLWHIGNGTLHVQDLDVTHGSKYVSDGASGNASGGCIFSSGTVVMENSWTKYCGVASSDVDMPVRGGAIYAKLGVGITNSAVTDSAAHSTVFEARGGGVYTPGILVASNSVIANNIALGSVRGSGGGVQVGSLDSSGTAGGGTLFKYSTVSDNSASADGGGVYVTGNVTIGNSTISGNSSAYSGALSIKNGANVTAPAAIFSTTVSSNEATVDGAGGIVIWNVDTSIKDSTIAFNTSIRTPADPLDGSGVSAYDAIVDLHNTIISNNTSDTGTGPQPNDIGGNVGTTLTGSYNLIYSTTSLVVPAGTLTLTDPHLRPLANNGGTTFTHMPNVDSYAIDAGNNSSGATVDQRGIGFSRIWGSSEDIGAVESTDGIFRNDFEVIL
ncbi:MAG: choice-of-anchor Q domain-containing protein [Dokdonella sp.]